MTPFPFATVEAFHDCQRYSRSLDRLFAQTFSRRPTEASMKCSLREFADFFHQYRQIAEGVVVLFTPFRILSLSLGQHILNRRTKRCRQRREYFRVSLGVRVLHRQFSGVSELGRSAYDSIPICHGRGIPRLPALQPQFGPPLCADLQPQARSEERRVGKE